jgi:hypothetical protein
MCTYGAKGTGKSNLLFSQVSLNNFRFSDLELTNDRNDNQIETMQ